MHLFLHWESCHISPVSYTHLGKFADIIVAIGPVDEAFTQGGLQFIDEVKGGNVPKGFIPSVQKGFQTAMKNGVLAGYPRDSLKVVLKDGSCLLYTSYLVCIILPS